MNVSLIAAMGLNGVIGDERGIPWRMPRDLRRFRSLTMGKPLIMGRKTAEHLGKPLPGRDSIVLTRSRAFDEGWTVVESVEAALEVARESLTRRGGDEAMVIGGGEVYRLFLPQATRIYLTIVEGEFTGSATFPADEMRAMAWTTTHEERHAPDDKNAWGERFAVLERE